MADSCNTCSNWINWKKTGEGIAGTLRATPSWSADTAVMGRCRLTDKMTRKDDTCDKYNAR